MAYSQKTRIWIDHLYLLPREALLARGLFQRCFGITDFELTRTFDIHIGDDAIINDQ